MKSDYFKKWQSKEMYQNQVFIYDGAVDQEKWEHQTTPKVLFLLEEAHCPIDYHESTFDLIAAIKDCEEPWGLWQTIVVWAYCLHNVTKQDILRKPTKLTAQAEKKLLSRIAFVNVKKSSGKPRSPKGILRLYASEDKEELKKQIDDLKPDIIVCGGTLEYLKIIFDKKIDYRNDHDHYSINNYVVIDFYHPNNSFPKLLNYYGLGAIYQDYLRSIR